VKAIDFVPPDRLLNKNFVLLLQGQAVSLTGNFIYLIGLVFWLKQETDSPTMVGLFTMTTFLPSVILGPFGGVVADRCPRKQIIVLGDLINGSLMLSVGAVIFYMVDETSLIISLLFMATMVSGVVNAFFGPAVSASILDLVPRHKIQAATGILLSTTQVSMLIGRALGGLLFIQLGMLALVIVNGISFLVSAFSEGFISLRKPTPRQSNGFWVDIHSVKADVVIGIHHIRRTPGMTDLFLATAVRFFFMAPVWTLLPFFVEDILRATLDWYGYLMAAQALGMILGSVLAAKIRTKPASNGVLFLCVFFLLGIGVCFFGYSSSTTEALLLVIIIGMCIGFMGVLVNSALQLSTTFDMRGRVFGLMITLSSGLLPISMGLSGIVADILDRNFTLMYTVSGLCVLMVVCFLAFRKGFHQLMSYV
jgi:MFS family permease